MDSSEDVAFRHTALERENRELLGSLKNLTELKSRAELENKELQATLEKLQAKLVPCSTAEIIKNPRDNASSKKGGLKTNSSVANGAHRLNRNNPNSLPQLSTPRRNVENPKPSVDDILQMKFPDVFPPTEDKTMRMSSKHFTTQASRQSMNVEKLLRRHEQHLINHQRTISDKARQECQLSGQFKCVLNPRPRKLVLLEFHKVRAVALANERVQPP